MNHENLGVGVVVLVLFGMGFCVGGVFGSCTQEREVTRRYESRAVANGCAIRVLDSASGVSTTVWKDGKP